MAAVLDCYARHNRGDQRGWLELFADDMEFSTQGTRFVEETTLKGKDAVVKWFID